MKIAQVLACIVGVAALATCAKPAPIRETTAISATSSVATSPTMNSTSATPSIVLSWITYSRHGSNPVSSCMNALDEPRFLLFDDGELILINGNLFGNYEQTRVTKAQSDALIDSITSTGLLERPPIAIEDSWGEITVQGKKYFLAKITSQTDVDSQVVDALQEFRPKGLSPFFPDRLRLEIYQFSTEEELVSVLPFAMALDGDWERSPLKKFGTGETIISKSDMELVKQEFTGFPQAHLYSNHTGYTLVLVCADFEQPGQ